MERLLGEQLSDSPSGSGIPRSEIYPTVEDPEQHHRLALMNGAKELSPLELRNWGDLAAYSLDLDGHVLMFEKHSSPEAQPMEPKHILVSINCSANDDYAFASDPMNLTKWASEVSSHG